VFEEVMQVAEILSAAHKIFALYRESVSIRSAFGSSGQPAATYKVRFLLHDIALYAAPIGIATGKALSRDAHPAVTLSCAIALTSVEASKDNGNTQSGRRSEGTVPAGKGEGDGGIAI
jgi:hypothetical protein